MEPRKLRAMRTENAVIKMTMLITILGLSRVGMAVTILTISKSMKLALF